MENAEVVLYNLVMLQQMMVWCSSVVVTGSYQEIEETSQLDKYTLFAQVARITVCFTY